MQNFNPWVCLYGDFTTYKVEFTYFLLLYCKPCTLNRDKALILIFFFLVQESKKQMSVSTTISKVRCSYCKSEWLDQWEFYWFGWLVCSIIVGLEKKPSTFLFKTLPFYLLLFLSILSVFTDCHGQLRSILITIWWISALLFWKASYIFLRDKIAISYLVWGHANQLLWRIPVSGRSHSEFLQPLVKFHPLCNSAIQFSCR